LALKGNYCRVRIWKTCSASEKGRHQLLETNQITNLLALRVGSASAISLEKTAIFPNFQNAEPADGRMGERILFRMMHLDYDNYFLLASPLILNGRGNAAELQVRASHMPGLTGGAELQAQCGIRATIRASRPVNSD